MHVHVTCPDGEAKFWLEPLVALANSVGLSPKQLKELQQIIEEEQNAIARAWAHHFRR